MNDHQRKKYQDQFAFYVRDDLVDDAKMVRLYCKLNRYPIGEFMIASAMERIRADKDWIDKIDTIAEFAKKNISSTDD